MSFLSANFEAGVRCLPLNKSGFELNDRIAAGQSFPYLFGQNTETTKWA